MRGFNYKKSVQALNFLAIKSGGEMNKMKAIKLIWLADRLHLREHGRTITGDIYFAMKHGPVPTGTRDILEENSFLPIDDEASEYISSFIEITGKYHYKSVADYNHKVFSITDIECLQEIFTSYGKLAPFDLRDLSHKFPEWKRYEASLKQISTSFEMNFEDFFEDVDDSRGVFVSKKEMIAVSKELYFENVKLRSL